MIKKQILAIGGAGFHRYGTYVPSNFYFERYFLEQTGKAKPKVCFIPTASGESQQYLINFYQAFSRFDCQPSHLSLFQPHTKDIEAFLLEQDAIFVGGGNTKSMLAVWREWSVDTYLRRAYEQGTVLGGVSAGSICWFEEGVTDSIPGPLTAIKALGFLPGSNCPHYDGEVERRPAYHRLIESNQLKDGIAIDDHVAVHYINGSIAHVVKTKPQGNAYQVCKDGVTITETIITAE